MANVLAIIIMIILSFLAIVLIPMMMTRRAANQVIRIFRKQNALSPENARTAEELRLAPLSLGQRIFKARDYKPRALDSLIASNIVQRTEDGKLFLSEKALSLMLSCNTEDVSQRPPV